jgi:NAD(P)-dependent dehydrogenase (short-subunit alcohol dehydrogenase family)
MQSTMQSNEQLKDRIILITGASDGIGRATAIECASQGATVIIHGKATPKLETLYDEIVNAGHPEPVIYPLDFEKMTPEDCDTLNESIQTEFGRLDALFNNAGWLGASSPIQHYDQKLWHRVMQINLNASFMLTQTCLPLLSQAGNSAVVFNLDDKATAYWGAYGVAKAGLEALMKILADELESTTINVSGIYPGAVRTGFRTRAFPAEDPTDLTLPAVVARAACYLLSDSGRTVNGNPSHGKAFNFQELLTD